MRGDRAGRPGCPTATATFEVTATTEPGENVYVVGSIPALGSWNPASAVPLSSAAYPVWRGTAGIPVNTSFEYKYIKRTGSTVIPENVVWENDPNRTGATTAACAVTFSGSWNGSGGGCAAVTVTVEVNATTTWGQNVYVVGSIPVLGSWNPANAVPLSSAAYPVWRGTVSLPPGMAVQYKYVKREGSTVIWESDPNRSRTTPSTPCTATWSDTWR